jgi:hypothetical protein
VLHWGIEAPQRGVLAAPGTYTVKLFVGDREYSQNLEVRRDPNSRGSEDDVRQMVSLWLQVANDINEVVDMLNQLEWVGKQLEDMNKVLAASSGEKKVGGALSDFRANVEAVEDRLLQRQLHASDPKSYRDEMMLYEKLLWFSGEIGTGAGDIRNTEDYGPTSQQLEVYEILKKRLADSRSEYRRLLDESIPELNRRLQAAGFGGIVAPKN